MKYEELFEGKNTPVIVIDVQPAYGSYARNVPAELMEFLNQQKGTVLAFYNGDDSGVTDDNESAVRQYYLEEGLDENRLRKVKFREKDYAWFRNWMDQGMDDGVLIKVVRHMVTKRIYDSRDIDEETYIKILGEDLYRENESMIDSDDGIFIPDISLGELKKYSGAYICGGAKHECFKEFTLLMNAFNIKYKEMKKFIY